MMKQLNLFEERKSVDIISSIRNSIISTDDICDKINLINEIKIAIHDLSPFRSEPVDCVIWVKNDTVQANDYNPNAVAPPEMELLRHSINHDGYTQPVVTWVEKEKREVIDGFHRTRVCKECDDVRNRVMGYLPVVTIKEENTERMDRIASTIRHNRARGKHVVSSMTDIVVELKKRNWSTSKIGKELGMDPDEVLRLCQVSGLTELFSDENFSKSWDIDIMSEDDIDFILDEDNIEPDKDQKDGRILHTYEKWECFKDGFYNTRPPEGLSEEECENIYKNFLSDIPLFEEILGKVITEWKFSCEHYLSNDSMNRIAWLGQASLCYKYGIPSQYRGGYNLLSPDQQELADRSALKFLNKWLIDNNFDPLDDSSIKEKPKADIY